MRSSQYALSVSTVLSVLFSVTQNTAEAGFAVAGCDQTGVVEILGNTEQTYTGLSDRAVTQCSEKGGANCIVLSAGAAGGFVAIARGEKFQSRVAFGCQQDNSLAEAKLLALTQCRQAGGSGCRVIRTFVSQ